MISENFPLPFSLKRSRVEAFIQEQKRHAIYPLTRDIVIAMRRNGAISEEAYDGYIHLLEEYLANIELHMRRGKTPTAHKNDGNILSFEEGSFVYAYRRFSDPMRFIASFGSFLHTTKDRIVNDNSPASFTISHEKRVQRVEAAIELYERIHTPLKPRPLSPRPLKGA